MYFWNKHEIYCGLGKYHALRKNVFGIFKLRICFIVLPETNILELLTCGLGSDIFLNHILLKLNSALIYGWVNSSAHKTSIKKLKKKMSKSKVLNQTYNKVASFICIFVAPDKIYFFVFSSLWSTLLNSYATLEMSLQKISLTTMSIASFVYFPKNKNIFLSLLMLKHG